MHWCTYKAKKLIFFSPVMIFFFTPFHFFFLERKFSFNLCHKLCVCVCGLLTYFFDSQIEPRACTLQNNNSRVFLFVRFFLIISHPWISPRKKCFHFHFPKLQSEFDRCNYFFCLRIIWSRQTLTMTIHNNYNNNNVKFVQITEMVQQEHTHIHN